MTPQRLRWAGVVILALFCALSPGRAHAQTEPAPGSLAQHGPFLYPPEAKAKGLDGSVKVKGTIGKDGIMRDVRVVAGPALFRQAALDAVATWVYHPYLKDGVPVVVKTTVTVNFRLTPQEKAAAKAAAHPEATAAPADGNVPQATQEPKPE